MEQSTRAEGPTGAYASPGPRETWIGFASLWGLQAMVAFLLLREFLDGTRYFAYLDIAADTYEAFTGYAMHLARLFAAEGFSGWSFTIGWGAPTTLLLSEPFRLLNIAGGADQVLPLRIWIYVLKIVLGGSFFLLMVRPWVRSREAALVAALCYSFSGYVVSNGVWDPEALPFVFFPLILWAIGRYLRQGDPWTLPLAVAAALLSNVFFLTLGVSLAIAFAGFVAASEDRAGMGRRWLRGIVPLVAIGYLLASPLLLPTVLQLLDSPRVSGQQSLLGAVFAQALQITDVQLFLEQAGALFHKDLYGVGDLYRGYMNYLEGPGFYVGVLMLLAASQLWGGSRADRRLLVVVVAGTLLYFLFPVFRLAAFGFASPYFRATTLWIILGLLFAGARGLDRVLHEKVDAPALGVAAALLLAVLGLAAWKLPVSPAHAVTVAALVVVWVAVLLVASRGTRTALVPALLLLTIVELVAVDWPSYFALRRTASPSAVPAQDVTQPALAAIRAADRSPFYRVEKTYQSVSESDAMLQDYHGVRSYYYHGRAHIDFHQGIDLMRKWGRFVPINKTNWTAAPQERYFLYSLLGVRYVISKTPQDWPGFRPQASGEGWFVYRNELALPLGFVQTRQVTRAEVAKLSSLPPERQQWWTDAALMNAAIVDQPMPQWGEPFDLPAVVRAGELDVLALYARPAQELQKSGLVIDSFRNDRIAGHLQAAKAGLLVFSIPAYRGWSLTIDGQPVPLMTANFGMLAAPVDAGTHQVVLEYSIPGLRAGFGLFACGLGLLALVGLRRRRAG